MMIIIIIIVFNKQELVKHESFRRLKLCQDCLFKNNLVQRSVSSSFRSKFAIKGVLCKSSIGRRFGTGNAII